MKTARIVVGPFEGERVRVLDEARTRSGVRTYYVERDVEPTKKSSATTHRLWVAGSYLKLED